MPRSEASLRCDCARSRSTDSNRPSTIRAFSDSSLCAACGIPRPLGAKQYLVHRVNVKRNVQTVNICKILNNKDNLFSRWEQIAFHQAANRVRRHNMNLLDEGRFLSRSDQAVIAERLHDAI